MCSATFATKPPGLQSGSVTVTAELRFRRLFQDLMDAKGWQTPDIIMEQETESINIAPHWHLYLPALVTP